MTPAVGPAVALTIAGSDSSGGAGIQADLATFAAHGVFGTCAVTALTAQNTRGVRGVHVVPTGFVVEQVDAVLADLPVAAVKTGMLATPPIIEAVASLAAAGRLPDLVVDPVMVASSGARLLDPAGVRLYVEALLPHATVVTPNVAEAEALLEARLATLDDVRTAALELAARTGAMAIVTGGHAVAGTAGETVDVVACGDRLHELRARRVPTGNDHGTGCSFSAALAAGLAQDLDPRAAAERAHRYVHAALERSAGWRLGGGHGPLDHLHRDRPGHEPQTS